MVNPKQPAKNVAQLVEAIKAKPNTYNYASPGIGTAQHLAGELFRLKTGVTITHVPYGGAAPSVTAVVAGDVQMGFASLPAALPMVKSGMLRALAITTPSRSPAAPDIRTFVEEGFAEVQADHMQGLLAPAGTPADIIAKLAEATNSVLKDPQTAQQLVELGFIVGGGSPQAFAEEIDRQLARWRVVVQSAGIKAE